MVWVVPVKNLTKSAAATHRNTRIMYDEEDALCHLIGRCDDGAGNRLWGGVKESFEYVEHKSIHLWYDERMIPLIKLTIATALLVGLYHVLTNWLGLSMVVAFCLFGLGFVVAYFVLPYTLEQILMVACSFGVGLLTVSLNSMG